MAIVNSIFMGDARKSAGNGTFRTVRGRTIVSQKVSKRGAVTGSLSKNQFALAVISRFASLHAADILVSFDPTTYGSSRNAFFKLNYDALKAAVNSLYVNSLAVGAAKIPSDAEIEQAIAEYAEANPKAIYRVKKSGYQVQYLTGTWTSAENPTPAPSVDGKVLITVVASPSSAGSVEGGGYFAPGEYATLYASPTGDATFSGWSDGVTDNPRTIVVGDAPATYTAEFSADLS